MLTRRKLPKRDFETSVPQHREELSVAQRAKFKMSIDFQGVTTTTTISLKFPFINADHHHVWGEFGCNGWVSWGWTQQEGVAGLLLHPLRTLRQCGQKCRVFGVSGDGEVTIHQPNLHNCKGSFTFLAYVVGRCLVLEHRLMFWRPLVPLRADMPRLSNHLAAVK